MKILSIALLAAGLLMSGAVFANSLPEGNGNVNTASYAAPEGNGGIQLS